MNFAKVLFHSLFRMDRVLLQNQVSYQSPSHVSSNNGFPIMAIAVLGIMATIFLLVSYYIYITKCCFFNWQTLDPLRRFSFRRRPHQNDDLLLMMANYSPNCRRGLDELLIREIPTFQYSSSSKRSATATATATGGEQSSSLFKCVVCLNEFQDRELLRLLPKCNHAFHLDCIDIWLQNNANCPLCRTSISGKTGRDPFDVIPAPNSSPQEPQPFIRSSMTMMGSDEDFVVIEMSGGDNGNHRLLQGRQDRSDSYRQQIVQPRSHSSRKSEQKIGKLKPRKFHHVSIMGDECINVREKDDQFSIQPIRRSFSMDSAADRQVFLSVQEIIRHNRRHLSESRINDNNNNEEEESSSRSQRSIFSFGHSRGSKRTGSVLPLDQL